MIPKPGKFFYPETREQELARVVQVINDSFIRAILYGDVGLKPCEPMTVKFDYSSYRSIHNNKIQKVQDIDKLIREHRLKL